MPTKDKQTDETVDLILDSPRQTGKGRQEAGTRITLPEAEARGLIAAGAAHEPGEEASQSADTDEAGRLQGQIDELQAQLDEAVSARKEAEAAAAEVQGELEALQDENGELQAALKKARPSGGKSSAKPRKGT